jgi:hypothetical protein
VKFFLSPLALTDATLMVLFCCVLSFIVGVLLLLLLLCLF